MKKIMYLAPFMFLLSCSSVQTQTPKELELNILHINDHHSNLEPSKLRLKIDGVKTDVNIGGYPEIISLINEKRAKVKNPLVFHAGDAMTGTLYFTLFDGIADAEMMNQTGIDYFTLGNHEFDAGNEGLKKFLDHLKVPVVSANVVPQKGSILEGYWKPYNIRIIDGEKVGIIGLDVVKKTRESSSPGKDILFTDEILTAQTYADLLKSKGVNKIILVSHAGAIKNMEIARKVSGIDVIITGDTHLLFADESLKDFDLPVWREYPVKIMSPANEPVYVVEAWEYSKLLGHLKVNFDKNGVIESVKADPLIPYHEDSKFTRKDKDGKNYDPEGEERDKILKILESNKYFVKAKADKKAAKVFNKFKEEKQRLGSQIVGVLEGEVMPGGSPNRIPSERNPKGSIATRFISETTLNQIRSMGNKIDLAIQNSGGVRADIKSGEVSFNDAYTILPFANTLYLLEMTGAEVKQVLEDALQFALVDGSSGAFPYGAGIRYEANKTPDLKGNRIVKVEIQNEKTGEWELLNENKKYRVGTNSYIAQGKDGYKTFGKVTKERGGEDTFIPAAESLIKFLQVNPKFNTYTDSNVKFNFEK